MNKDGKFKLISWKRWNDQHDTSMGQRKNMNPWWESKPGNQVEREIRQLDLFIIIYNHIGIADLP